MIRPAQRLFLVLLLATSAGSTRATSFHAELDTSAFPSGEEPQRFEVVLSQEHLSTAWPELLGPAPSLHPAPSTHLDSGRVIVQSVGTQPDECYSAAIQAVRDQGDAVLVEVMEKEPAPNCVCTLSLVKYFQVIRIDSEEGPATLCIRRPALGC